jgi:hypothetical protein
VPRSHPEGYSVNVRCLDPSTIDKITMTPFDGRHWEETAAALPPLSPDVEGGNVGPAP